MIGYNDLTEVEKKALKNLIEEIKPQIKQGVSVLTFLRSDLDKYCISDQLIHTNNIIEFLIDGKFISLWTHQPSYQLLNLGKILFKQDSIEEYFEKAASKFNTTVVGNNNIITIASRDIQQDNISVNSILKHKATDNHSLLNVELGKQKSNLNNFHHWICEIRLNGKRFTAQFIYNCLNDYCDSDYKKEVLNILNARKEFSSDKILFMQDLYDAGVNNHFKEFKMEISQNNIRFEFAQYKSKGD
jgi:hypothetical protein